MCDHMWGVTILSTAKVRWDRPSSAKSWNSLSLPIRCIMWLMVSATSSFHYVSILDDSIYFPPHAPGRLYEEQLVWGLHDDLHIRFIMDGDLLSLSSSSSLSSSAAEGEPTGGQKDASPKSDSSLPQSQQEPKSAEEELWWVCKCVWVRVCVFLLMK